MGTTETSRQVGEVAARGEDFRVRAGYRRSLVARHLWKTTALTTLALGLSGVVAHGDPDGLWQPQIRAIIGADNNGGNAALEGFIPIKQTAESVLFLDVRAKHDFKDAFGQDVGLGIRRIVNPDLMIGGYAYLNVENYNSTQFTSATLGAEAITPNFDAHVNVFIPIKGDSTDHSASSTLSMVSNQLIEQISVLDHRDYAAWGIEGEVGAQVPINLPDRHSLRLDIGGYHFEDPHGDDGSVTGAKAGFEYTIGDVFGSSTELVLAGEVRNDNRDHTQFAGSVRLNIPFNPGHGTDTTASVPEPVYPVSEGLRRRVNERVRGDIGVRVQSQEKTGGSTTRVAINAATNAAFGKFYFADGGLAGAGTQADPTTLDDAVTKAGSGGFVVALGGNGNLTTAGVTLANGQTVIGGGESVTAKLFNGSTATFNLGGSDGTIQGTNVANNVITLGTGNTLNGITITGGANGILGNNATGTTLTNVTVTGTAGNGADFTGNSTNVTASNFTATGNGLDGLHIEDNGTYNFTGTTLLQSNLDDGLDITGQGTYTFAIVNALNNTDRGITVQGTSTGGTFTTTGGTVSGNGGTAVFVDPITAHVVLDSITQSAGTSGVVLDHVSGSFTVNGATTISNTTGPAIAITDSPATIRFGDINITNPGAGGMSFSGVNAAVVAGNIVISGLGVGTGLDFSGSQTNFTARSLAISGPGAVGSIGIDLADTTGGASIIITNGGSISGVGTGVRLGISGSLAHSANAEFSFGGGSIAGNTASLDARGLNQTLGHYAFGSTTFSGPQLFDVQNVIFVGSMATGLADGSSLSNLASITTADANTDGDAIFVLVNDGTSINASGGFSLSDGQTLASFGNGRSFSLGGVPINVTGDNVEHDQVVSDPGGGAATLTNSGAGNVVTAANGNSLLDFNISGGSGSAIYGLGINGLTVQGVTVGNVAFGLYLNGATGTVSVDDLAIQSVSQTGIALVGSSATVNFTGNTKITSAASVGLFANNFDGIASFDDLDITGGGHGVSIWNGSSGTLTFGTGSSIANTGNTAFDVANSSPHVTYNGTIDQATAASAVNISNMTGGTATFGGKITASTGAANAINLTGNAGSTISFTGGLDLTTTTGTGFNATGGTINVAAAGTESIATGTGRAINLDGVTIGTGGVAFDSITTGVTTATALNFNAVSGGPFLGGNVSVGGSAIGGLAIANSSATFTVTSLATSNVVGADVSLTNNTGSISILGGTITNSGTGDGVVVSGGSATIGVAANISSSATLPGTAVKVDGTTGGSVTFSGSVTSTGTGNLFVVGSVLPPTGGAISLTGPSLSATGGGGVYTVGLAGTATLNVTAPLSITGATSTGLAVANVASTASATFGAVTVTGAGADGIGIANDAGSVTFGTTQITLGSTAGTAGINFALTNAEVSFGTTTVTLGAGANQTGIDFSGSSTAADFGVTTITGTGDLSSRGIDLSSTTGDKTITFQQGSKIDNVGVGVELASSDPGATSANANFTFGDGNAADGLESTIIAAAGGYTVNTIGLDPTLGNYDFDDVAFTGNAHLASAVGGTIMVSQNGGVIAAGTDGLSAAVTTVTVAQADAMTGTQKFAFVGTVDLSGTPFTLDSGQSIIGFGNGASIITSGTIQPVNVQGNLGATGGNVTGDEGVVKSTGSDTLHLLGSNQVRDTAFDFSGGSGSVFLIDQSVVGFDNTGGTIIDGVTVSNVAAGQRAFKVDGLTGNLSITDNNINVAGTLLDVDGGTGNITVTRGNLPNSGPAGTLTGGGISIANRSGGLVNFTDKVTVNGNGVSLTNNTGATITFADLDIATSGATAFSASGGGTVNVTTGTINATSAQAVALDSITAGVDGIHFASTSATFSSGNGIDLQDLSGTITLGTGTLTNTGTGTSFNVGTAAAASGGNADISYGGTINSNGSGAAVSIQGLTGGSVTLSGNLTDSNAAAGGNIVIAGNDSATITFSGTTKQISSGATDGVNIGIPGGWPSGPSSPNTNSAINFTGGGLDITTTGGRGFIAAGGLVPPIGIPATVTVTGSGNKITSGSDGLLLIGTNVGSAGIAFDNISAVATVDGAGVGMVGVDLAGDVNIGGLKVSGAFGIALAGLTGAGEVNFIGTTDIDVSAIGIQFSGQIGTVHIADVLNSSLTVDGGSTGISFSGVMGGTVNIGNGGSAKIGATTSTIDRAIGIDGNTGGTLNYNGSINVSGGTAFAGSVVGVTFADLATLNLSGSVTSTTSSAAFDFAGADGTYTVSSTIDHTGGTGVHVDGFSEGTITFSGTTKTFDTGANNAVVKDPSGNPGLGQGSATLAFTNGGLSITTSSGAGFSASTFGAGTVSVSGTGNTIATGTGTTLNLDGATVGADGITFDTISTNGAATGISLNNVGGGTLSLGAVDLEGITSRGVDISGTLGSALDFTSLKVGLNAANAVGLDLNGAALGASNITAGDFDVDGGSFAGTIGIDMAGTTGTGTIQLGDTVNNNPGGQTSKIENVGYGVQFSSATNARLVFGDGQGPAESSIATTGGQVIHATDTLPTNGDYNFNDVTFTGDTSNLSAISVYYVTSGGSGNGSLADPGSYVGAQGSTANVIVLIDKNVDGSQETIDLSGTTFNLDDGQVLLAFKSGDAAIDVSQLGVDTSSGASAAFHFTTVQNSPIISAPGGIDTLRPILQSNNATSVVNLATSGTGTVTGGMENLIVRDTGSGAGIAVTATTVSNFFLRNNDIAAGGRALDFSTSGAPANTLLLSIDGNTLKSTGSALAASFVGQNISATANSIEIQSFADNTVLGGTGGGIAFNNVGFDSNGAGGTVSAGTIGVGSPGPGRVQGDGLSFTNTSGTLDLGAFSVFNNGGTGVLANTKTTNFTLNSSSGGVFTANGAAFDLDPLTVNMVVTSISSGGSSGGIIFDGVAGTFTVTGNTSVAAATTAGIMAINAGNTGVFTFNTVTLNSTVTAGGGIQVASGTLNITGLANIDTTTGVGLSQTGGTVSFTGGVTIDTTSGTGIVGTGGTMGITATAAAETVKATAGQAINLSGVAASIALDSTNSVGGANNVSLTNVTGTVGLGSGALSGATSASFLVNGGTAAISYGGTVTKTTAGKVVDISGVTTGTITLSGNLSATGGFDNGVYVHGNTGGTFNFSGATKTLTTGANNAIDLVTNAGATINFTGGGLAITTTSGTGFNATGGGTVSVGTGGNANTISAGTGVAVNMNGVVVAAGGVNFASASNAAGGTSGVVLTNVTGPGTVNLGTGTLNGGSAAAISITGGSVNLTYAGNINQANNAALVSVLGGHTGTLTLNTGTLSATNGTGLQFDNADGIYNFNGTTTLNGGDAGIDIVNGSSGTFSFNANTSITNPTGVGLNVNGGNGNITYAGSISKTNTNNIVSIQNRTGGTTTLSGALSATGGLANGILVGANTGGSITFSGASKALSTGANTAVNLTTNTGATIDFTNGGLAINTTSGTGFNATGGGTVSVQGTGNTITSTTGTALDVENTNIGSGNLVFQSITSNGGSANGIILVNTGTAAGNGGLHVTGTGSTASGGTIANKTGADGSSTQGTGIFLNGTKDVQLGWMQLSDFQNYGIYGSNVTGFTLDKTIINGTNGTSSAGGSREGAVAFDGLFGTASITNSTLGGVGAGNSSFSDDLRVMNTSGTLNMTVDNVHFGDIGINGNNALTFSPSVSGAANLTVTNSFFTNAIGTLLDVVINNNVTSNVVIRNNAFSNNNVNQASGGANIVITGDSAGQATTVTYDVSHNTLKDAVGIALLVAKGNGKGTWSGTINANTIGTAGVVNSGSTQASGIKVTSNGTGSHTTLISNNVIHGTNEVGIFLQANDSQLAANGGGQGVFNASIFGNTVGTPGSFSFAGLSVDVGAVAGDNNIVNLVIGSATDPTKKNDFSAGDPSNFSDVNLSQQFSTTIRLYQNGSSGITAALVIDDDNLNPATTNTGISGTIVVAPGTGPALPPPVAP
ncbi:hypothetical protein [Mesorhizobium sp. dw_380]|uniref:beta strand repeat-containing protein n=1 Tax=Mesorhizobium sp. dw_380 TaxID=2812001 RepID=UPI001BDE8D9E|nr:hypothetical protein [Mesorhizobium sp. dw_380]